MISLEHIDINIIRNELREDFKLLVDSDKMVMEKLLRGISFRNNTVKVEVHPYYNHLAGKDCFHFYFICPKCLARCRKLYIDLKNTLGCRKCSKIKQLLKVNTQQDRILRIQFYLNELCSRNITAKKRKKLVKDITHHYQELDNRYKMLYNTIAFKELQKWCLTTTRDKTKNVDYKKATKDMLVFLRDIRKVLVFAGLSISKNSKLKI